MAPNWDSLVAEAGFTTEGKVVHRRVCGLWAGYGSVTRIEFTTVTQNGRQRKELVVKQVDPPKGAGVSHNRKIESYRVESSFYTDVAPHMQRAGVRCPTPQPFVVKAAPGSFLFVLGDIMQGFPEERHSLELEEALVALDWLAAFHAFHWEAPPLPSLWQDGCYWHLATRQDELASIGARWAQLKQHAAAIDAAIATASPWAPDAGAGSARRHRTLCHGDFKSANFVFARGGGMCAAYDFQYVGAGYGMKDVAYLLASSVDEGVLTQHEAQLLDSYHERLLSYLSSGPRAEGSAAAATAGVLAASYSRSVMQRHYELCLLDYCRFQAGWGWWGASSWAQRRVLELLPRLPHLLKEQRAERADDLL